MEDKTEKLCKAWSVNFKTRSYGMNKNMNDVRRTQWKTKNPTYLITIRSCKSGSPGTGDDNILYKKQ